MAVNSSKASKCKSVATIVRPSNNQLISVGYESVGVSGGPTTTTMVTFPASKSLNQIHSNHCSNENRVIPIGIPITVSADNIQDVPTTVVTSTSLSSTEITNTVASTPAIKRPTTIFTIYSSSNSSPKTGLVTPVQSKSTANLRQEF